MKFQTALEEQRKKKEEIIEDMKACITYQPDRDNDLLCLMEQYLKGDKERRPRLLHQIRNCMDGENYDNPFSAYYCYSPDDIARFDQILSEFIDQIKTNCYTSEINLIVEKTVHELNHFNANCRNELIDAYRREKLIVFFEEVGKLVKCEGVKGIINEYRTW